jgi:hypothetical protein
MLDAGVSGTRAPILMHAGLGAKHFEGRTITHAIYATGWDGTVVFAAQPDGTWRVEAPAAPVAAAAERAPLELVAR